MPLNKHLLANNIIIKSADNINSTINNSNGDGSLEAINSFYNKAGNIIRQDTINQQNWVAIGSFLRIW